MTRVIVSTDTETQAAAVVFRLGEHDRRALADFARELTDAGYRVGGMVQESFFDEQGRRTHIDSVDLATGDRAVLADAGVGFGPRLFGPSGLAPRTGGAGLYLVTDEGAALLVETVSGDRVVLSL